MLTVTGYLMSLEEETQDFGSLSPEQVLKWAWQMYGESAVFTSSFGAEDMVIMDMLARANAGIEVATLDTGRLPEETYTLMEEAAQKYGIKVRSYFPDYREVESMVNERGMNLFYSSKENRKLCCRIRKVEPLGRLLKNRKAWITGLRADQTANRSNLQIVETDPKRNIVKINPLIGWSSSDVWDYIRKNDVPYNSLHDRGYPSIGCQPCTRAISPGEDERAGRWWWEDDNKECGLHVTGDPTAEVTTEVNIPKPGRKEGGSK